MRPRRSLRPLPRLDMTPFVNVALLLIVFFVWMKMLQKEKVMGVHLHDNCKCEDFSTLDAALFLLINNRIGFLTYHPDKFEAQYIETTYEASQLRKQLIYLKKELNVVIIIPSSEATLKNVVDVLDAIRLRGNIVYRLAYKIVPGEQQMLHAYTRYKAQSPTKPVVMTIPLYSGQNFVLPDTLR